MGIGLRTMAVDAGSHILVALEELLAVDALNVQQEERLARRRAQLLQLPYVDLFAFPFEPSILEMVPKTEAQVVGAVLFYKRGNDIKIGAVNPQIEGFVELLDRLKVRFGLLS